MAEEEGAEDVDPVLLGRGPGAVLVETQGARRRRGRAASVLRDDDASRRRRGARVGHDVDPRLSSFRHLARDERRVKCRRGGLPLGSARRGRRRGGGARLPPAASTRRATARADDDAALPRPGGVARAAPISGAGWGLDGGRLDVDGTDTK